MKKYISLLLVLLFVLQFSTVAFAFEGSTQDSFYFQNEGHGQFKKVNFSNNAKTMEAQDISVDDVIAVNQTNNDELLYLSNNQYLSKGDEDTYFLVDQLKINVDDFEQNNLLFESYNIPVSSIREMSEIVETQKSRGNAELEIEVYVPSKISVLSADETNTSYYEHTCASHNKIPMRNTQYIYRNTRTDEIEKKSNVAKRAASDWVNLFVSIGGVASQGISIFGAGMSLLDFISNKYGEVTTITTNDYTASMLILDFVKKDEDAQIYGTWTRGCVSNKVWLNRVDTHNWFKSTGSAKLDHFSVNREFFSPNYNNPHKSLEGIMSVDSPMTTFLYDVKVILNPI